MCLCVCVTIQLLAGQKAPSRCRLMAFTREQVQTASLLIACTYHFGLNKKPGASVSLGVAGPSSPLIFLLAPFLIFFVHHAPFYLCDLLISPQGSQSFIFSY